MVVFGNLPYYELLFKKLIVNFKFLFEMFFSFNWTNNISVSFCTSSQTFRFLIVYIIWELILQELEEKARQMKRRIQQLKAGRSAGSGGLHLHSGYSDSELGARAYERWESFFFVFYWFINWVINDVYSL